jgi:hypothetical protein
MGEAIILIGFAYMPLAIIFIVYFVKLARRTSSLAEILQREAECRIRINYELPPPTDPMLEMTREQLIDRLSKLERVREAQGWE